MRKSIKSSKVSMKKTYKLPANGFMAMVPKGKSKKNWSPNVTI